MSKKVSKRKELWEIMMPEAFKIDPILRDEDLIQTMSNFNTINEMNSFLFECLAIPEKKIIVSASEYDILHNLWSTQYKDDITIDIVNDENNYAIVVKDSDDNIIGKGAANRLGKKITVDDAKEKLVSNFEGFSDEYTEGITKIESLVFRAKSLRDNMLKNQEIKENN